MEKTKMSLGKKIMCIILAIVIVAVGGVSAYFLWFKKVEISSAQKVFEVVSNKLVEVSNTMAQGSSGSTSTESSSTTVSNSIGANLTGFSKAGAEEYLWMNELSSRIIYAVDFIARNATVENGYANGFEYGKVYSGAVDVDGYNGVIHFLMNADTKGVNMLVDFNTEEEINGEIYPIAFKIKMYADYDYDKEEVKTLKMNYVITPFAIEMWSVEYDFVNNNFKAFQFYDYTFTHAQYGAEIIENYNNGTLDFDKIITYYWTHAVILSGNITDNINNLRFDCYEYWRSNTDSVSDIILKTYYNSLYNSMRTFTLRTAEDNINTTGNSLVTYIQDAIDYGWNKASFTWTTYNGKTYYIYNFIEYEDMVNYLTQIKSTITENQNECQETKDVITSALNYITNRGATGYTGELGTYDGITTTIDYDLWIVDGIIKIRYNIMSNKTKINFELENKNVSNLVYGSLTYKRLYELAEDEYIYANEEKQAELDRLMLNIGESRKNSNEVYNGYYNIVVTDSRSFRMEDSSTSDYYFEIWFSSSWSLWVETR